MVIMVGKHRPLNAVFGTLSEQQWSDDNMAATLLTGNAKLLVL